MKGSLVLALNLGLVLSLGCAQQQNVLVVRNVTVIDGTGADAKRAMTVVIEGRRIAAIGKDESLVYPASGHVIDGTGKYLIPGLWDMHVHLRDLDGTLALFIVNGVTTVRDMGSDLELTAAMREEIEAGRLVGPRIKTAGMAVESSNWVAQYIDLMREQGADEEAVEKFLNTRIMVGDPREARTVVDSLRALGADFIKIRHAQSPEVFAAIAAAAADAGTHLVGHYVWILSLEESADGGQRSIEHNIFPGFDERTPEQKQAIFEALLRNDTHLVPTLVTNAIQTLDFEGVRAIAEDVDGSIDARNRYVSRTIREGWIETVALDAADDERPPPEVIQQMIASSNRFLLEARQAGVKMMAGTDVPTTGTFLGFSLHDELALLVETYGMTPMEALRSATALPAAFMGLDAEVGTIEVGKRADLVLLDADPLADVKNTRLVDTVIASGRVFDRATREEILSEIGASIAGGANRAGAN
ncbi:MAG: amidohydrolase family protein [Gemmatimonadota bacterium]|nr:MAG: amidohydrolase family protein [Gemmatimonadota bacterium]